MPRIPNKRELLHRPYRLPRLHAADRADCLMRGTLVVASWTAGAGLPATDIDRLRPDRKADAAAPGGYNGRNGTAG
jgi:hypothetical protein